MVKHAMHRQVLILAAAQALFQTASVLVGTVGSLAGAHLAPAPALATVPIATMFLGTATATFPASTWMARFGRRVGFITGALLGTVGGVVAALGIWMGSFALLCVGTYFVGTYQGFAQFYRFAAAEVADDAFRPRAIALVLGGGVIAAVAGPTLARLGGSLFTPQYVGSFLLLVVVTLLAIATLFGLRMPPPKASSDTSIPGRPWRAIVSQPQYLVALFGAATGYGVMTLAMTATPIAMTQHQHDLSDASLVIQFHVLGMFLPSFFTGYVLARFGTLRIMLTGVVLFTAHVLITLMGTGFGAFAGALVFLGIGWNFLYIGGTTLLTTTYTAAEKARAQATNDMTIFVVGLVSSLSAGALLEAVGWQRLNLLLLPWLVLATLALVWFGYRRQRNGESVSVSISH